MKSGKSSKIFSDSCWLTHNVAPGDGEGKIMVSVDSQGGGRDLAHSRTEFHMREQAMAGLHSRHPIFSAVKQGTLDSELVALRCMEQA